ncbi:translesion DNA synthesis-associated protein ImuA [Ideonella sp. DXS29W]|uniref:Translesion DNA synthesis-associated protein ImuA n=1 Tax=Ideonella lacteola TaxID=2984193 RepID=A0ABU9BPQ9_9BURK
MALPFTPSKPALCAAIGMANGVPVAAGSLPAPPAVSGRAELLAQPTRVHPGLWRAQSAGGVVGGGASLGAALSSGFTSLDAELPGAGWPVRVLTELLLAETGVGEIRLLAPMLSALAQAGRSLMLFDPPAEINAVALAELGVPLGACIVVRCPVTASPRHSASSRKGALRRTLPGAELCWSIEQALRSGQVGAVLAWPGRAARPEALRRLQLAAQSHEGPAFLLREWAAQAEPSPAPLRVTLQVAGADALEIQVVKRKGPAMAQPLRLMLAPVLSPRAQARASAWPLPPATPEMAGVAPGGPAGPPGRPTNGLPQQAARPGRPVGHRRPPSAGPAVPVVRAVVPPRPGGPAAAASPVWPPANSPVA